MIGKKCGLERGEEVDEHRVSTPTFLGKEREREVVDATAGEIWLIGIYFNNAYKRASSVVAGCIA